MISVEVEVLTADAFRPFGDVMQADGADSFEINGGTTTRFHDLTRGIVDADGSIGLSIFRGRSRPLELDMLERHPLASQSFFPLGGRDWLVAVADRPVAERVRVFRANGMQGVNYGRGIWHHPLLVLGAEQDFLVMDRIEPDGNLEECALNRPVRVLIEA